MLTKKLCLVLGAGASSPYGFPTGGGLLEFARTPNDDWWPIAEHIFNAGPDFHMQFLAELRASGAASLDEFVGRQTRFKDYAKALIAFRIGECESRDTILGATGASSDWVTFFIRRLVDGVDLENLGKAELSVVTFNFDRCLEETFLLRLGAIYREPTESDSAVRVRMAHTFSKWHWPIVHVHGSLGPLSAFGGGGRPYERTVDPKRVLLSAQRITLLDDAQADSPEFQTARGLLRDAEFVLFLGFGFHRMNCKRVLPQPWGAAHPHVVGTAKEMSPGAMERARRYFLPGPTLQFQNVDSLVLLQNLEHLWSE
jgi:SIR2-like domain